ncbi:MAG: hypothetical protein AABY22_00550 [Nanoarchaeota archaeon]
MDNKWTLTLWAIELFSFSSVATTIFFVYRLSNYQIVTPSHYLGLYLLMIVFIVNTYFLIKDVNRRIMK